MSISVTEGIAGIGWYDDSGLAEEIFVAGSASLQRISLTVWRPKCCRRLVVRNVQNKKVSVNSIRIKWIPIDDSSLNRQIFAKAISDADGFFLDQAFRGHCGEALWNIWRQNRFDKVKKLRRIKGIVQLAWQRCPGYREYWKSNGWHPSNLRTLEDVDHIPVITKELIRSNLEDFTLSRRDLSDFATSGTTGSPFTFRYTPLLNAAHLSAVAIAASYGDCELLPWQQRALVIRRSVRGASATGAGGSLILNASAIYDGDLLRRLLQSYRPTLLFGWPSHMSGIAQSIGDDYKFRLAILGSENIFDSQIIEANKLAIKVIGTYGLSEGAGFGMRCYSCGAYAELDTHGIISFNKRSDGLFDIIGTSFWSRGTLFIRYDTGDTTVGPVNRCSRCPESTLYFKTPSGRSQDFVLDRFGARHALAMIVGAEGVVKLLDRVQLFDFVQVARGELLFRYVTTDRTKLDEHSLAAQFERLVGDQFNFSCRYDPRILDLRNKHSGSQKWTILKRVDFNIDHGSNGA